MMPKESMLGVDAHWSAGEQRVKGSKPEDFSNQTNWETRHSMAP